VHPAQLSLLPEKLPMPASIMLAALEEEDVGEAISLLGALIAKASPSALATRTPAEVEQSDE
jgi:hypothetical protein